MDKELNEDARTKQDLLYECSNLESRLSDEIVKNEYLEQQCQKQKEVIDKLEKKIKVLKQYDFDKVGRYELLDILKEVSEWI